MLAPSYPIPQSSRLLPPKPKPEARWRTLTTVNAQDAQVAQSCGISPVTAAILRTRGLNTPEEVNCFLDPDLCGLHDPMLLPDVEIAVARLHRAIESREPMLVYGDYDVDGVTSTAMLMRSLKSLGANVSCRIPERKGEGYGLNVWAMDEIASSGIKFILTADCGIRDLEAVSRANELGMDVIVTDHHEPGEKLPDALAVINPKRHDSAYPFRELSGCGVAFKLMQALLQTHWPRHVDSFWEKFVEFAAMAAIADCVPLENENRILAREGLRRLASTQKHGLIALKKVAGLRDGMVTLRGGDVGFRMGPRLNAAGRLDSATKSLDLLMAMNSAEADDLAAQLEQFNILRRDVEKRIVDEACKLVESDHDLSRDMAIVVSSEGWHGGVVGLVASRLTEKFSRPALVFNRDGAHATGSGRSFGDFNLHQIIEENQDLIVKGGGHAAACGMTVKCDDLDELRNRVLDLASQQIKPEDCVPLVEADCEVSGRDLSPQLARDLEKLEPCGMGNPEARLMLRGVRVLDGKGMGKNGEHLKWFLEADGVRLEAVWFRPGERAANMVKDSLVDLCFVPELNVWNGQTKLQLMVKDARLKK